MFAVGTAVEILSGRMARGLGCTLAVHGRRSLDVFMEALREGVGRESRLCMHGTGSHRRKAAAVSILFPSPLPLPALLRAPYGKIVGSGQYGRACRDTGEPTRLHTGSSERVPLHDTPLMRCACVRRSARRGQRWRTGRRHDAS